MPAEKITKDTKHQDKRWNLQKHSTAAKEEMRKIREDIDRKEERFRLLSDKVDKNRMADAEMEAEHEGLQAGEERRGSNASQTGNCCMEKAWQHFNRPGSKSNGGLLTKVPKRIGSISGVDARKRRRKKEQ